MSARWKWKGESAGELLTPLDGMQIGERLALIRVMHVQPGKEPELVEVDGEAGIDALLGAAAVPSETQWSGRQREAPVMVCGPASQEGDLNYWVTGADRPERGPRVIALLDADGRFRTMPDFDGEVWFWRVSRWRLVLVFQREAQDVA